MLRFNLFLFSLVLLSSCLESDPDEVADLTAPVISANGSATTIRPEIFLNVSPDASVIPLEFSVSDESGIGEIKIESHSGFDGHSHGRIARASNFVLFSHYQVIGEEEIADAKDFSVADESHSIYLDDRNPAIDKGSFILAGPYHFSIKATDLLGNETSYIDNSTYHTTLFIERAYAPQITGLAINPSAKTLSGTISRNMEHEASSDIIFLWINVEKVNEESPQEGEILYEKVWGSSNWPHQFRPNEGSSLPNNQTFEISALVEGDDQLFQLAEGNKLTIWAEDANGNISVKTIR